MPIWSITRRGRAPYSLADDRPLLENSKKRIRSAFLVWTPDQINSTGSDFEPPYVLVTTPAFPNGRTRRKELRMNDDGQLIEYHPSEADTYRIEEEFGATINDMFN